MNRKTYASILASVFLAISFLTGCSSTTVPPVVAITATVGTPQSAQVNTPYAATLQATVTTNSKPVSGVAVLFTAPGSGASGTFATSGTATESDKTDSSGVATSSTFTANNTFGAYSVVASVNLDNQTPSAGFSLTNTSDTYAFYVSGLEVGPNPYGSTRIYYAVAGMVAIEFGNVLGGELDYNDGIGNTSPGEPDVPDTITAEAGALVVDATGQGTLTLTTSNTNLGVGGVITLGVQFVNANHAIITQFDGSATSSGSLDLQTAYDASGNFAFTLSGVDPNYYSVVYGGVFSTSAGAATGVYDVDDFGAVTTPTLETAFTGTVSTPDSYGRGTVTGTNLGGNIITLAYYVVGPEAMRLIDVDPETDGTYGAAAGGSAFGQGTGTFTNASLGSSVFGVESNSYANYLYAAAGSFTTDGAGTIPTGVADADEGPGYTVYGSTISGDYSIASNGYGSLTITPGDLGDVSTLGIYLTDPNLNLNDPNNTTSDLGGALVADLDGYTLNGTGVLTPQTDTAPADFTGSASPYAFGAQDYYALGPPAWEFDLAGVGTFTAGAFSGTGLLNDVFGAFGTAVPDAGVTFTGTPLADADESTTGRYTLSTFNVTPNPLVVTVVPGTPVDFNVVIYQASGTQAYWLNEQGDTLWLGPIEQQGSLTGVPALKTGAVKSVKHKKK